MKIPDLKLTNSSLSYVVQELSKLDVLDEKKWRIKVTDWSSKRTLSANAQLHVFIGEIAKFTNTDALTAKCEAKIDFGLPVLLMADDDRSWVLDHILGLAKFYSQPREWQLRFISAISITSLLTTRESKVMMDDMIYYWNDKGLDIGYKDK